ncbi:MAG: hypothetical protein IIU14_05310 [Ruminococcus sp.]|nr:hypothetical protein [Ruminococcus sp.]
MLISRATTFSTSSKTAVYTSDKEDRELLSRVDDAVRLSSLRHSPTFLGFLNEREQYIIKEYFSNSECNLSFFGGYDGSKRNIAAFSEYELDPRDYPLKGVYFKFRKTDKLSHRDFLGALMGLGIERSSVGDIVINEGQAVCFVKSELYDYIVSQILKIGRVGVRIVKADECSLIFEDNIEELSVIVSSMRLDAVAAALTGLSRAKTAQLILSGSVAVNYLEAKNVSCILKENDILSIRKCGKFVIKKQSGLTKKGRLKIIIEHYR